MGVEASERCWPSTYPSQIWTRPVAHNIQQVLLPMVGMCSRIARQGTALKLTISTATTGIDCTTGSTNQIKGCCSPTRRRDLLQSTYPAAIEVSPWATRNDHTSKEHENRGLTLPEV